MQETLKVSYINNGVRETGSALILYGVYIRRRRTPRCCPLRPPQELQPRVCNLLPGRRRVCVCGMRVKRNSRLKLRCTSNSKTPACIGLARSVCTV